MEPTVAPPVTTKTKTALLTKLDDLKTRIDTITVLLETAQTSLKELPNLQAKASQLDEATTNLSACQAEIGDATTSLTELDSAVSNLLAKYPEASFKSAPEHRGGNCSYRRKQSGSGSVRGRRRY